MALTLPPPVVPGVDEFGVLDLDQLAGEPLITHIQLQNAPPGYWLHPHWRGTSAAGEAFDVTLPAHQFFGGDDFIEVVIPADKLNATDQGYALYSYQLQPTEFFQPGFEESLRKSILIGKRYFPGTGLNVAVIHAANRLQFDHDDLGAGGARLAVLPWQAMAAGDRLVVTWRGYRSTGAPAPVFTQTVDIDESAAGFPVPVTVPAQNIRLIAGGIGVLSYEIEYAHTSTVTPGPSQSFTIEPADHDYLPALTIDGHSGGTIDPGLYTAGMTFSIQAFSELVDGDALVIYVEDALAGIQEPLAALRLDRSSVDSERLQCTVMADWLAAYVERDIRLTYHVARPRMDRASLPLALSVRETMQLPAPVVQGASGAGQGRGEFKAQDTGAGIKVWVPGLAVYPVNAAIEMHWVGFGGAGSHVERQATGDTPPAFIIPPRVVAPNFGKEVRVFYRVTVPGEDARDSQVFTLSVLPMPQYHYPTLDCVHAPNGVMSLARVPASGSQQTVAPWPLMALGQKILLTATGTLNGGGALTKTILNNEPVNNTHMNTGVRTTLEKLNWLDQLEFDTTITFTMRVSADEGASYVIFPRVYVTLTR